MSSPIGMSSGPSMHPAQVAMAYATSVTKMAMDTQELAADMVEKMMPTPPPAAPGPQHIIDTYA